MSPRFAAPLVLAVTLLLAGCAPSSDSATWFDGSNEIATTLQEVRASLADPGAHYEGLMALMPGLTGVELVEQDSQSVTIQTGEGLLRRTNLVVTDTLDQLTVEFDEEFQAGQMVKTRAHFRDEFTAGEGGVIHRVVISNVQAPGFLGFFYRNFGSSNTGLAFLGAYKTYFESGIEQ